MAIGSGRDQDAAGTLRGVVFILAAGLALGTLYNSIGRASRPPRGLAWVKQAEAATTLEALQRATPPALAESTARALPGAATWAPPAVALAATPAARDSAHHAKPGDPPKRTGSASAKPEAPARTAAPAGKTTAASAAPVAPAPAAAPAVAPAAARDLPVIPDLDRPIQLELASLKKLYDAGAVLVVDAREAEEYADGHIAGALSLPYNDAMAEPERMKRMGENGRPIAVYCSGGACELSMDLAKLMLQNGRHRVLVYEGGFPEWKAAGLPVVTGTQPGGR